MPISEERYGDALVLTLTGRIDNSTTDGLKSGLDVYLAPCRAGGDRLVLDFSNPVACERRELQSRGPTQLHAAHFRNARPRLIRLPSFLAWGKV